VWPALSDDSPPLIISRTKEINNCLFLSPFLGSSPTGPPPPGHQTEAAVWPTAQREVIESREGEQVERSDHDLASHRPAAAKLEFSAAAASIKGLQFQPLILIIIQFY
jgi:hypothetical protein